MPDDEIYLSYPELDEDTLEFIRETLPHMKPLLEHLRQKMLDACTEDDQARVELYAWSYGEFSATYSNLETLLPYREPA